MPYWMHYAVDSRVLLALVVVSFLAVLVFGLVPAVYASKTDPNRALKDGGRTATHSSRRLATVFLAAELAIAIVLAMQFTISWRGGITLPSDAAVETTAVLTAAVTLPSAKYATAEQRSAFTQQLLERLPAVGGVTAASAATSVPLRRCRSAATRRRGRRARVVRAGRHGLDRRGRRGLLRGLLPAAATRPRLLGRRWAAGP